MASETMETNKIIEDDMEEDTESLFRYAGRKGRGIGPCSLGGWFCVCVCGERGGLDFYRPTPRLQALRIDFRIEMPCMTVVRCGDTITLLLLAVHYVLLGPLFFYVDLSVSVPPVPFVSYCSMRVEFKASCNATLT